MVHMPRKIIPPSSNFPYHVTARTNNREFFKLNLSVIWEIYSDYLFFLNKGFDFNIHLFVLMNNHFHLVVDTPDANLGEGMNYFLRETSRIITRETNSINHLYGGRYFRSLIQTEAHYRNVYRYCYQNPIRAGIVRESQSYPFSTLRGLIGFQKMWIPLCEDVIFFSSDLEEYLEWINCTFEPDELEAIRAGLRKTIFKLPKNSAGYLNELNNFDAPSRQK